MVWSGVYNLYQIRFPCSSLPPNFRLVYIWKTLTDILSRFHPINRTTMQEISSLLSLCNASITSCFAPFCGSFIFSAMSTASWLDITWSIHRLGFSITNRLNPWIWGLKQGGERDAPSIDHHLQGWVHLSLPQCWHLWHQDLIGGVISGSCLQKHGIQPVDHSLVQHPLIQKPIKLYTLVKK